MAFKGRIRPYLFKCQKMLKMYSCRNEVLQMSLSSIPLFCFRVPAYQGVVSQLSRTCPPRGYFADERSYSVIRQFSVDAAV